MKIKFNWDDELPLNKTIEIPLMIIVMANHVISFLCVDHQVNPQIPLKNLQTIYSSQKPMPYGCPGWF